MIEIKVLDDKAARDALRKLGDGLPRALAEGLNRTMRGIEQAELNALETHLDRPIPFSMNAFGTFKARPYAGGIDTVLYIKPVQAEYLKYPIEGGVVESTLTPVIGVAKLNAAGNIPGKQLRGMAGAAPRRIGSFIGQPGPKDNLRYPFGLWKRVGRDKVQLVVKHEINVKRKKRMPYYETAEKTASDRLQSDVLKAISEAVLGK